MRVPLYRPAAGMQLIAIDDPAHTATVLGRVRRGRVGFHSASWYNCDVHDSKGETYRTISACWVPRHLVHLLPKS